MNRAGLNNPAAVYIGFYIWGETTRIDTTIETTAAKKAAAKKNITYRVGLTRVRRRPAVGILRCRLVAGDAIDTVVVVVVAAKTSRRRYLRRVRDRNTMMLYTY